MRRLILIAALALGFAAAGSLLPSRAEAMPISSPAAVQEALKGNLIEQVRYVCRRVWRCSYYGCGWRRSCYWRPRYRYSHRRYYYPRHYYYRPYRYYRYGWRW